MGCLPVARLQGGGAGRRRPGVLSFIGMTCPGPQPLGSQRAAGARLWEGPGLAEVSPLPV